MTEWVEVSYAVDIGGTYQDGFWADSNTVQQVVSAAANHATVLEKERIIKLLKGIDTEAEAWFTEDIIALIKGEKNE